MAEESYSWFTLMIAVPKTPEMQAILAPFVDARGDNDQGVDVIEYHKRMAITIYCQFEGEGVNLIEDYEGDCARRPGRARWPSSGRRSSTATHRS